MARPTGLELLHLTRDIAYDLGPIGIRVTAIAPGAIRTAALQSVLAPEIQAAMLSRTPLGRLGEPWDIALARLFHLLPGRVVDQRTGASGQRPGGTQELD